MTGEALELARVAVTLPAWDWRVGMKAVADDDGPAHSMRVTGRTSRGRVIHSRRPRVPDLEDEATLGRSDPGLHCVAPFRGIRVAETRPVSHLVRRARDA